MKKLILALGIIAAGIGAAAVGSTLFTEEAIACVPPNC